MSFFKKLFAKKKKKTEQSSEPIPRSGMGGNTTVTPTKLDGAYKMKSAWIDSLKAPSTIKKGEILKISVSGNFSDLGYKLESAKALVNDDDIIVSVIGAKKTGTMAGQALKPYTTTVEVKELKKGKYTIKPEKGKAKELQVKVQ